MSYAAQRTALAVMNEPDAIGAHLDGVFAFMDRRRGHVPGTQVAVFSGRSVKRSKAFSISAIRGKSIFPSPVAVAEFAGGEKIRMSFWQAAGRPWNFIGARRLLAQTIGNERAHRGAFQAANSRYAALAAAHAIADRGATEGERAAGVRAVSRLKEAQHRDAKKVMERLSERIDALAGTSGNQPATDFVMFHVEHDGKTIQPEKALPKGEHQRLSKPKKEKAMSQPYNVAIKWHLGDGDAPQDAIELVQASTSAIALKVARRAFLGRNRDAVIAKSEIVFPEPSAPVDERLVAAVINIKSAEPIPDLEKLADECEKPPATVKTADDLSRLLQAPGMTVTVIEHWNPERVGKIVSQEGNPALFPKAAKPRFNEDGSVTFYPKGKKSWTLRFAA